MKSERLRSIALGAAAGLTLGLGGLLLLHPAGRAAAGRPEAQASLVSAGEWPSFYAQIEGVLANRSLHALSQSELAEVKASARAWLLADPGEGANFLNRSGLLPLFTRAEILAAFRHKAGDEPAALLALSRFVESGRLVDLIARDAWTRALQGDPKEAYALSASLPEHLRKGAIEEAIAAWVERDGADAARAIIQAPEANERTMYAALASLQKHDPKAAWDAILETDEAIFRRSSVERLGRAGYVARFLESLDPASVSQFAQELPDSLYKRTFFNSSLTRQLLRKPDNFSQLVQSTPGDISQFAAVTIAAEQIAREDPAYALSLLEAIPPERRNSSIQSITRAACGKDLAAAAEWVQGIANPQDKLVAEAELRRQIAQPSGDAAPLRAPGR